jgi:hypothetical protein
VFRSIARSALKVWAVVLAVALVGGFALADIPNSGIIHGCYKVTGGALRVIDTSSGQRCTSKERALPWNQQGPAGTNGADGTNGTSIVARPRWLGNLALPARLMFDATNLTDGSWTLASPQRSSKGSIRLRAAGSPRAATIREPMSSTCPDVRATETLAGPCGGEQLDVRLCPPWSSRA